MCLIKIYHLRILIVVDPGIPVPPIGYGGIERVVAQLAEEYSSQGHRITILASKGSKVEGSIIRFNGIEGFPQSKISPMSTFTTLEKLQIGGLNV